MIVIVVFLSSSGVERSAVNRFVVGSNPTWGDKKTLTHSSNKRVGESYIYNMFTKKIIIKLIIVAN